MSRAKAPPGAPGRRPATKAQSVGARTFDRQARRLGQRGSSKRPAPRRWPAPPSPRELLRRVPTAAWLCALVAFANAAAWSIITPPFQVPDEPEHVAYVSHLAETGGLPTDTGGFSLQETIALADLNLQEVAEQPEYQTISSKAQQEKLQHDLAPNVSNPAYEGEYAGVAASEPPLYYALEVIPYDLGGSGTLLDRIELMRLTSALFGALTALFAYLFVRETLPRARWAWTVGGLGVALVPLLGFMSGAVNPDSMLYAVTAALFYALARAFARGLTRALALALGALIAIGLMTKLNFVGIAPGALLGLVVLALRAARTHRRAAYVSLALALTVAISPAAVYVLTHVASGGPALGFVSSSVGHLHGSLWSAMSYIWQLYLPRLPGMHDDFAGLFPLRQLWFNGYVGRLGWLDTTFPGWIYELALIVAGLIACLCARQLVASAKAVRARALELAVYGVMCAGLLALVGVDSYIVFPKSEGEFAQARYLLPMLPLLAAVLALAARGAGRRWGPAVGAAILMLFFAHDIFSQLQVIARFYG